MNNNIEESKEYINDNSQDEINKRPKIQYLAMETERLPLNNKNTELENTIKIKSANKMISQTSLDGKIVIPKKLENQNTRLEHNNYVNKARSFNDDRYQSELIQEESKLINHSIALKELSLFMCSNLDIRDIPDEKVTDRKINLNFDWNKIKINNDTNDKNKMNIILKNKILKLENSPFSLRTLGVEIEISLLMAGESNLWVFTRCKQDIDLNSVCCHISKEQKSTRKFISFAILDTCNDDNSLCIKTLKKQEVPKHDISETKLIINENGDRKYLVSIENSSKGMYHKFYSDFFLPVNDLSNIMIGATGDLVSIKNIAIRQVKRSRSLKDNDDTNVNSQQCACCTIF